MKAKIKPDKINAIGFERTEKGYYGIFEITGIDEEKYNKLKSGIIRWKDEIKDRGSEINITNGKVILKDFFTKDEFELEYPHLFDAGPDNEIPERIDEDLLGVNIDLAMIEQNAEFLIDTCMMTDEELKERFNIAINHLEEIV